MNKANQALVGVGLRHEHYSDALNHIADIDFVEIHAENFFCSGGKVKHILDSAAQHYSLSIHATSLGLGSVAPPDSAVVEKLAELCNRYHPMLVSDHVCFNRATVHGKQIHTGDLLPLRFNQASLDILSRHVDTIQQAIDRPLLLENLSAYLPAQNSNEGDMSEYTFLNTLCDRVGSKLLFDVNNVLVNFHNQRVMKERPHSDAVSSIMEELQELNPAHIAEYHLAGATAADDNELMIDDHAATVSDTCWLLYEQVLKHCRIRPTLIEWDQHLPDWRELIGLAHQARDIQLKVMSS